MTPLSFRHPVHTARTARDVDDPSGGRLTLGLGAGWQEREHETFGFDLLEPGPRFGRFEEGVAVVADLLRSADPVSFAGEYFELDGAKLLPRPSRDGAHQIAIGGNGRRRTMPLATRRADEWHAPFATAEGYRDFRDHFEECLLEAGRNTDEVRYSMMVPLVVGRDGEEVERVLEDHRGGTSADELRSRGAVVGTPADAADRLNRLGEGRLDLVMGQWLALDETDRLEVLADAVV